MMTYTHHPTDTVTRHITLAPRIMTVIVIMTNYDIILYNTHQLVIIIIINFTYYNNIINCQQL